jgi:hypothetical protein
MQDKNKQSYRTADGEVDRTRLSSLYPEAKTFAQRADDDDNRRLREIRRQPKFIRAKITLYSTILIAAITWFVLTAQAMWLSGSIAIIFLSFGISLAFTGLVIAYLYFIRRTFYDFNRSASIYVITELILITGVSILFYFNMQIQRVDMPMAMVFSLLAHLIALYAVLLAAIRYERF